MSNATEQLAPRDAYLNLVRLHERLAGQFASLFRSHGLSSAQYNVLRILAGGARAGVPCQYVGERLLNRVPDVTRLIDRMVAAELVTRERSEEDRRVVLIRITEEGRKRCRALSRPVQALHAKQFEHLAPAKVRDLNRLLLEALEALDHA